MQKLIAGLVVVVLLTGCGNYVVEELNESNLCVKQVELDKQICYGDEREKVELITGNEISSLKVAVSYDNGLAVMYRDGKVAGLHLSEEAKGLYETTVGLKIGQTMQEAKKKFATENAVEEVREVTTLGYYYDSIQQRFMNPTVHKVENWDELEKYYIASLSFNNEGEAMMVILADLKMIQLFE